MKRTHRKYWILIILLILGGIAWQAGLFRAGDCLIAGGRWVSEGQFCRLDSLARPGGV